MEIWRAFSALQAEPFAREHGYPPECHRGKPAQTSLQWASFLEGKEDRTKAWFPHSCGSHCEKINEVRLRDLIKSSNTVILQIMTEAFFKAPLQHFKFIQSRNCFKWTFLDSSSFSPRCRPGLGTNIFYLLWGYISFLIRLLINYSLHGICRKHV